MLCWVKRLLLATPWPVLSHWHQGQVQGCTLTPAQPLETQHTSVAMKSQQVPGEKGQNLFAANLRQDDVMPYLQQRACSHLLAPSVVPKLARTTKLKSSGWKYMAVLTLACKMLKCFTKTYKFHSFCTIKLVLPLPETAAPQLCIPSDNRPSLEETALAGITFLTKPHCTSWIVIPHAGAFPGQSHSWFSLHQSLGEHRVRSTQDSKPR